MNSDVSSAASSAVARREKAKVIGAPGGSGGERERARSLDPPPIGASAPDSIHLAARSTRGVAGLRSADPAPDRHPVERGRRVCAPARAVVWLALRDGARSVDALAL